MGIDFWLFSEYARKYFSSRLSFCVHPRGTPNRSSVVGLSWERLPYYHAGKGYRLGPKFRVGGGQFRIGFVFDRPVCPSTFRKCWILNGS